MKPASETAIQARSAKVGSSPHANPAIDAAHHITNRYATIPRPSPVNEGRGRTLSATGRSDRPELGGVRQRDPLEGPVVVDAVLAHPPQRRAVGVHRDRAVDGAVEPVDVVG